MSDLYIQIKYARFVGQNIERWKIKKENPFHGNGRCNICGDSAASKVKCRFHIIQKDDCLFVKCFNCDYSSNLIGYLKTYFPSLHSEYIFERYKSNATSGPVIVSKPIAAQEPPRKAVVELTTLDICYIKDLPTSHPARLYVDSRHIPEYPFQYTDRFFEFASKYNPDLNVSSKDEPRLIIPFFDRVGNVFAFQGRDLSGKSSQKYITIVIDKKVPKIFGIGKIDLSKPILIVEGPIDSLFLPNCLASVNASLVSTAERLKSYINKTSNTIVFDNEPRNTTIVNMYEEAIKCGYKIVIWPKECDGIKDINDMALSHMNPRIIIEKNTYVGLSAQIAFSQWKRI